MVKNIVFWTPINPLRISTSTPNVNAGGFTASSKEAWGGRPVFELFDERDKWVARVAHETHEDAELLARVFANSLMMRAALLDCASMLKAYADSHRANPSPDRGQALSAVRDALVILQRTLPQPMAAPKGDK